MELKKILALFSISLLYGILYAGPSMFYADTPESFVVEPLSFSEKNVTINNEIVSFSSEKMKVTYHLKNSSDNSILLPIVIKCYPQDGARWLATPALTPDDFKIFEGDSEIDYMVKFNGKTFIKGDAPSERGDGVSEIVFQLAFLPNEEKSLTVSYENEARMLKNDFDTDDRLVERHFFHPESKKKTAVYSPDDASLSSWYGYNLLDFLLTYSSSFQEWDAHKYFIVNDFARIYVNDNFQWRLAVPSDVNEVVCRQNYFCPSQDFSYYHLLYNIHNFEENVYLGFRDKNLSKELLSKSDLFTLSKRQLSILRNSFYARHGYNLKNKELREYFEANCREQGVEYKVNPKFSESVFNEVERKNIELIKEMENMKEPMALSDLE